MQDQLIRSFTQFIASLEDGQLHSDLSTALQDAIAAVSDAHREGMKAKSKLVITLDLRHEKSVIEVEGDFKLTLPKAERGRSIFWATPDNFLSKSNPRQPDMFRDVTGDKSEPRTVA